MRILSLRGVCFTCSRLRDNRVTMLRTISKAVNPVSSNGHLLRIISPCYAAVQSNVPLPCGTIEQRRTAVVVERVVRAPLAKPGQKPNLKNKHKLLRRIETEHLKPVPDIQCILTDFVDGLGNRGDVLWVKRRIFRNSLYPRGLAVYASPENLAEFDQERQGGIEEPALKVSPYARMTARKLSGMFLPIPMSGDNPWTLNKTHVKVAFRKMFVELSEDCLEIPEDDITQPQDLEIKVIINKAESVIVKARIYLVYKDPAKNIPPEMPPLFAPFEKKPLGVV